LKIKNTLLFIEEVHDPNHQDKIVFGIADKNSKSHWFEYSVFYHVPGGLLSFLTAPYPPLKKASRGSKSGGQRFMTILPEKIFSKNS
jgi:hypothetical protein